jgi:signal transduction histidine kinase
VQEQIFEPFFSTKEGGTGLGLAVSRQILQAHGGTIRCESQPGTGTTFVIRLPRA